MNGIGSHQSAKMMKDEWLTPPELIEVLGPFDLDPCAPVHRPWDTARHHFTIQDDGLKQEWFGRVWCNPPYGKHLGHWLRKCWQYGNAMALIFARTETEAFFRNVWERADAVFFKKGRLHFYHVTGRKARANSGAPSVLVAYGSENVEVLKTCSIRGKLLFL